MNLTRFVTEPSFRNLNLQAVVKEINFNFDGYSFVSYTTKDLEYHSVLTEEGICFSSSFLAPYVSLNPYTKSKAELIVCKYHELPCFVRVLGIPRQLKYYIHSPYEIPDSRSKSWTVLESLATDTYFTFLSIEAHPSLKDLRPQQRKCYLREEAAPDSESPFYSFKLCQMDCRRKLCMKYCKCVPHFYMKRADQPVCDLKGLVCLSKYANRIIMLNTDNGPEATPKPGLTQECECYPSCAETEYILQRTFYVMQKELLLSGMRYSWYLDNYPKIAVRRRVIFSLEGLLVSLGGIASFFVGSSIISAIEFVYFFTIRLLRRVITHKAEQPTRDPKRIRFDLSKNTVFTVSSNNMFST
ncbi:UNVERIFIED_CONTAM: hypothetical protein PYX00_009835 [Menopon gallinae]